MRFEVLGPLRISGCGADTPTLISARRLRVLLAALLLYANQPVPAGELAELVWDGNPPPGATNSVRAYVMRLRRVLGAGVGARIVTRDPGYLVQVAETELDVLEFEALCAHAGVAAATQQWAEVSATAARAVGLWRSSPLIDIPAQGLRDRWVPRLERLHVQALDWHMDAELHLGRHQQLVPQLRELCGQHPLRERFHAQLMLALARCGQRGDALQVYQQVRRCLIDELGIEPGPELRAAQQRILAGTDDAEPSPAADARAAPAGQPADGPGAALPRQLPAAVRHFTGRQQELRTLTERLDDGDTVVISAIDGTAGVGKTALALHWAHQVAARFPDGQLYVDLRGYDLETPMPPAAALATFLRALGVGGQDIPVELDERATRYRSLLAGRRVLVVLDNAGTADQVRPLLPGTPGCTALVTSRDSLAGLVARDGACRVDLDTLDIADAVTLLRALIGDRVDIDPVAARALAEQCARLPLALRVAAERAATLPATPLADLVADLTDQQRRLYLLDAGRDPRTAVRTVLSWSYRHLDTETARAFRLAGLHAGDGLDEYALAALVGSTVDDSRRLLAELTRAHLVQPAGAGRYTLHDLLRAYARELTCSSDTERQRRAALSRLSDYYLRAAAAAMDAVHPSRSDGELPDIGTPLPPVPKDAAAALAWLETERANLLAVVDQTVAESWHRRTILLAASLHRFLYFGGHHVEAFAIHSHAVRAAGELGDRAAQASALCDLAVAAAQVGPQQVTEHLTRALALFREIEDRHGSARALLGLGLREKSAGRLSRAMDFYRQALAVYGEVRTGDTGRLLVNLGELETLLGHDQPAAEHLAEALAVARRLGDRSTASAALDGLGTLHRRLGDLDRAEAAYREAMDLAVDIGFRYGIAYVRLHLAELDHCRGRLRQADRGYRRALQLLDELGDRGGEAEARNGLGELSLAAGRPGDAAAQHAAALELGRQAGDHLQQARAHAGLGRGFLTGGEPGLARQHWQDALARYTALGTSDTARLRADLAALDGQTTAAAAGPY